MSATLADLHAPLAPILRYALATMRLPRAGLVLDLACGAGDKRALLAEAFGPSARFIALDRDRTTMQHSANNQGPNALYRLVVADAHALPLQDGCCTAVCCIAALGLFADPAQMLRETMRVLEPHGLALIVTSSYEWVQTTRWPAPLSTHVGAAYTAALRDTYQPLSTLDVGNAVSEALHAAGFAPPLTRGFPLDAPTPAEGEAMLLPWATLRPYIATYLDPRILQQCDANVEQDVELCATALVASTNLERVDKPT